MNLSLSYLVILTTIGIKIKKQDWCDQMWNGYTLKKSMKGNKTLSTHKKKCVCTLGFENSAVKKKREVSNVTALTEHWQTQTLAAKKKKVRLIMCRQFLGNKKKSARTPLCGTTRNAVWGQLLGYVHALTLPASWVIV